MGKSSQKQWAGTVLGAAFSSLALTAAIPVATAQSATQATVDEAIDIPAGSLGQSIIALTDIYKISILAPNELVAGKTAPAVSGTMNAAEALRRVLAGSGLVAEPMANGGFVIGEGAQRRGAAAPAPQRRAGVETLDEIIIYGAKEELTLQQVTASADVFTVERIEREALFDLDALLTRTPNVAGSASGLSIRGVNRNGFVGTGGLGATSNVYIDGVPASLTALRAGFNSLWDVAQTEVIRGPQSAIQGRNALAGGVFITTQDPTYDWEAKARIRYASFNTQQYAAAVSGPIIADQVAFRLSADYQSTDGFVENPLIGKEDFDFGERISLRGKLLIEPDFLDGLRIEAIAEYTDADAGGGSAVVAPVRIDNPDFGDFDFRDRQTFVDNRTIETETLRLIGDITYDLSEALKLRLIGTYEDADSLRVNGDLNDLANFPNSITIQNIGDTYSGEAQLLYDFGRWSGIVGAYYFRDFSADPARQALSLAAQSPFPVTPSDSLLLISSEFQGRNENIAFFVNTRFDVTDRWTLSFGLRYDNESVEQTQEPFSDFGVFPDNCTIAVPGAFVQAPVPVVNIPCLTGVQVLAGALPLDPDRDLTFDAFLPRGSITYHVSDAVSVFAGAQRGYRAGGTFLSQDLSTNAVTLGSFDPEFLTNYELGFRSVWLDRRLRLNGNLFYSLYTEQQLRVPGASGGFLDSQIVNAGRTRIYGLEMQADFQATDTLNVFGSLGLLSSEFRDFAFAVPGAPFDNLAGNDTPDAASVSVTVGASYEHEAGFFADGNIHYRSGEESDIFNLGEDDLSAFGAGLTERTGSSAIANLRIGYRHDRFKISGYVTNLFDDDTLRGVNLATVNSSTGAVRPIDEPAFSLREPRTFGVNLDLSF